MILFIVIRIIHSFKKHQQRVMAFNGLIGLKVFPLRLWLVLVIREISLL